MSALPARSRGIVALAIVVPFAAALWIVRDPALVSSSTMAVLGVVVMSLAAGALMTWRSAQATTTTSQIIHNAEATNTRHQKAPPRL